MKELAWKVLSGVVSCHLLNILYDWNLVSKLTNKYLEAFLKINSGTEDFVLILKGFTSPKGANNLDFYQIKYCRPGVV